MARTPSAASRAREAAKVGGTPVSGLQRRVESSGALMGRMSCVGMSLSAGGEAVGAGPVVAGVEVGSDEVSLCTPVALGRLGEMGRRTSSREWLDRAHSSCTSCLSERPTSTRD